MKRMMSIALIAACFGILTAEAVAADTAHGVLRSTHPDITDGTRQTTAPFSARIAQDAEYGMSLVTNSSYKGGADWSPDGNWIAYEQDGDIYVVPANGGVPELVTPGLDGYCYLPRFTPDSEAISFTYYEYDEFYDYYSIVQVYYKDNTLPYEYILDDALAHAFNSDGNLIVYRDALTSNLMIYNMITDNNRLLMVGGEGWGSSCFSPDDSQVVTGAVNLDGGMTLYAIPTAGGIPEILTESSAEVHNYPDYSPDGRWILFTDDYWGDLHAYDTMTGDWFQIFPGTNYLNVFGRFSPDGSQFVYLLDDIVDENSVYNVFVAPFTLGGQSGAISLFGPEESDYFNGGDYYTIEWSVPYVAQMRLEISFDGGANWELIDEDIPSTVGYYEWTMPYVESTNCLIRLSTMNNAASDISGTFTIETPGEPAAALYSPDTGETLTGGSIYHIQWDASNVDLVRLEFSSNYGSSWNLIANNVPAGDGGYDWIVPSTVDSDGCIIRIAMTDGVQLDISGTFTVTQEAVSFIDIIMPVGGEQWQAGTSKAIEWKTSLDAVTIWFSSDNKASWSLVVENYTGGNTSDTANDIKSYLWTVPDKPSQTCYIRINDENDTGISDVNRTPFTITEASGPEEIYAYDTGSSLYLSSPAIDPDGTVYIGTELNEMIAVNPDGSYKWSTYFDDVSLTGGSEIWASPALNNGTLYVGSQNGYFYALNKANGSVTWRYNAKEKITSSAAIAYDGAIYFGTNNGSFVGLNTDGTRKFTPLSLGTPILSSPAIGIDGTIYVGGANGVVFAITPDGYIKWEYSTNREAIFSSPAIGSDGTIYISTSSIETFSTTAFGYLYALSPQGSYKWSKFIGTQIIGSPVIGNDGTIYMTSSFLQITNSILTGRVVALDPKDGSITWTKHIDSEIISSPLAASDGTVYVGTATTLLGGGLVALSSTGDVEWRYGTSGYVASSPTMGTNGEIYFATSDGYLHAIQSTPGTSLADSSWPKFRRNQQNTGRASDEAISFVRVNSPNGGEVYQPGAPMTITWNSRSVTQVNIQLSIDGGATYSEIGPVNASDGSYTWTIPGTTENSVECLIRITDTDNSANSDVSNGYFSITQAAFVEVLSPSGGEQYQVGTSQTIKWDANAVDKLDLSYSTDGGATWVLIASEVPGTDGQYSWTVPNAVSADCKVRIIQTNNDTVSDISNGVFAIVSDTYIEVTSPAFGDTWASGSEQEIAWTFNGPDNVKIELSTDNGATWETISASTPALTGAYTWTLPSAEHENCFIRITDTATASTTDISPQFSIVTPVLSIQHTPIEHASENESITFTAQVTSTAAIDTVALHYDVTGERQFTTHTIVMEHVGDNTYRGTIEQGVFTAEGIEYYIRARDMDKRVSRTPDNDYYSIVADISNINSEQTVTGGSTETSYRMVSVPMVLNHQTMNMQLRDNPPAGENGSGWRLFWYDASIGSETDRYVEFIPGEGIFSGFEPGKAFWLITSSNFRLSALSGTTVSTAEPYTITLQSGWNDIANPWMFDISWEDIENPSGADLSVLYQYNGSWSDAMSPPTVMKPWHGYAVLNNTNRNVVIKLHPIPAGTGKVAGKSAVAAKPASDGEWLLRLDAQAGEARDQATYLGVRSGAVAGKDVFDHAEPPPVGGYVTVSFPHPEWELKAENYTVDMRSADVSTHTWAFDVTTSVEGEPVTVRIDGIESLPAGAGVAVIDRDTGEPVMLRDNLFSFLAGNGITERHFALTVDAVEMLEQRGLTAQPTAFLTARCYPNPFNPATTIQYALPAQAQVRIEIFNTLGQRIREFDLGPREAGTHEFYFDAGGLTTGLYIYRVSAGAQDVTDKMLLMK